MQDIIVSDMARSNPQFRKNVRPKDEGNVAWMQRQLEGYDGVAIGLVGGRGNFDFRLRVAQSHLRYSFTPSHWSHCFLMLDRSGVIFEISLTPERGFGFPGATNGMQESTLERYDSANAYPNIGVILVPSLDIEKTKEALLAFAKQRAVLDAVTLMLYWLGYGWGAGDAGNPILQDHGLPSAAMVETVCNTAGYDISPVIPSRSSTPEALWQATKWWYHAPRTVEAANRMTRESGLPDDLPTGAFFIDHDLGDSGDMYWSPTLEPKR
jgi:hypothetical protein